MNQQSKIVWEKLSKLNLIEGKEVKSEPESPWYIKLLVSISGWFGALFLVVFIGATLGLILGRNIEDFAFLLLFVGGGLIFFVYTLFKEKQSDFLEHFLLALSIAGQVMVIASLFFMFDNELSKGVILFTAIFQAFLMWTIPNYIHRMMSSFFMTSAFAYYCYSIAEPMLPLLVSTFLVAWLWMNEFNFLERKKIEAIAYGQTVALISLKSSLMGTSYFVYSFLNHETIPMFNFWWVEFVSVTTLLYVLWMVLKESQIKYDTKTNFLLVGAVLLLATLSFEVGGLTLGVMLLLVGFAHAHRLLMGLGIFSSLAFLSHYYYFLGETLMDKAEVLALMGMAFLALRWVMKMVLKEEVADV